MTLYSLVIFDLDGTLIDSQEDIGHAAALTLAHYDLPPLSPETVRQHIGTGVRNLLRTTFAATSDARAAEAVALFDDIYASRSTAATRPYPGIVELLASLEGSTKIVLTNKGSRFVDRILDELGLSRYFAAAFGREAFSESKPSRVPVDAILARFRAARERCIIVGDTRVDIQTGKAAGIATCGVLYGYGSLQEIRGAKPDAVAAQVADLHAVLNRRVSVSG